jgi:hypothetical protein
MASARCEFKRKDKKNSHGGLRKIFAFHPLQEMRFPSISGDIYS